MAYLEGKRQVHLGARAKEILFEMAEDPALYEQLDLFWKAKLLQRQLSDNGEPPYFHSYYQ